MWFYKLTDIKHVDAISNVFTAIGTVGAVIVALWLARKDNKPKLRVNATVGVITPEMTEHLWLSCINTSKLPIICTGFALNPNKFKRKYLRMMPHPKNEMKNVSTVLPQSLQYSARAEKHFSDKFFEKEELQKFLSTYKWIAKFQLKWFWRIVAITNVKEFEGKLSKSLRRKIISICFQEDNDSQKSRSLL